MIAVFQFVSALLWTIPLVLFAPAVCRVWRQPRRGPSRPDPLDVLVSPIAFIAALQIGFVARWVLFPGALADMGRGEIVVWAGLYTLSALGALLSIVAWRVARGMQ
jgi:hypothetical protein